MKNKTKESELELMVYLLLRVDVSDFISYLSKNSRGIFFTVIHTIDFKNIFCE